MTATAAKPVNASAFGLALTNGMKKMTVEAASRFQRGIAFELFKKIIARTPVDIGRLRGNWQITVTVPSSAPVPNIDKIGDATIGAAKQLLLDLPADSLEVIYITNNLIYARVVEFGLYSTGGGYTIGFHRQEILRTQKYSRRKVAAKELSKLKKLGVDPKKFVRFRRTTLEKPVVHAPKVTSQGFSKKASAGMVGVSVAEIRDVLLLRGYGASISFPEKPGAGSNP